MKRRLNTLSLQLQSVLFKALLDSNNWLFVHVCVCIFYVHKFVWGIVCFAMQQQCKAVPGQQMLGKRFIYVIKNECISLKVLDNVSGSH